MLHESSWSWVNSHLLRVLQLPEQCCPCEGHGAHSALPPHRLTPAVQSTQHCQQTAPCCPFNHCNASKGQTDPQHPAPFSPGPRVADEPPGTEMQGVRAASRKRFPMPRDLGRHGWGKHPRNKGQGKRGHLCPGDGKRVSRVCEKVAGAHAGPSSAEEPPPACVQPLVEHSSSLPPQRVWLPLALISCALSPPPPPSPAHPPVRRTARLSTPRCPRPASQPCDRPRIHPSSFH